MVLKPKEKQDPEKIPILSINIERLDDKSLSDFLKSIFLEAKIIKLVVNKPKKIP